MQLLCFFSIIHSETFDISHAFLPLTVTKLSTLKQVRVLWPTLYTDSYATILYKDRMSARRLRLPSHNLAIETAKWHRVPPDKNLRSASDLSPLASNYRAGLS